MLIALEPSSQGHGFLEELDEARNVLPVFRVSGIGFQEVFHIPLVVFEAILDRAVPRTSVDGVAVNAQNADVRSLAEHLFGDRRAAGAPQATKGDRRREGSPGIAVLPVARPRRLTSTGSDPSA